MAVLSTNHPVDNALLLLGGGIVVALILGGLSSLLLKRISGVAFGMVNLAISQMFYVYVGATKWTGQDNGIAGITSGTIFGQSLRSPSAMLVFVWVVVTIAVAIIWIVHRSRFGLVTRAARDSGSRAGAVGINTFRYHALAFIFGAGFCGIAGVLAAMSVGTVDVSMFYWTAGATPLLAGLLGGIRTMRGPIFGSVIISIITIWISQLWSGWLLIEGGVVLVIFLIWPLGLLDDGPGSAVGSVRKLIGRIRGSQPSGTNTRVTRWRRKPSSGVRS